MDRPFSSAQTQADFHAALTWRAGTPRFTDPDIEEKYRAEQLAQTGFNNRQSIALLITIFCLFIFTEPLTSPEIVTVSAWLRFAGLTPATLLFLLFDWRGWLGRWRRLAILMLAISPTVIASLEFHWLTSTTAVPDVEATTLLQLGALGLRLPMRQIQGLIALSCMIYIAGVSLSPGMPGMVLPTLILLDLSIGVTVLLFTTRADVRERRVFLLVLQADERRAQLAAQNKALARLLHMDALTGLSNRRCFDEALTSAWAHAQASRMPLALVMFDIDHFKKYNDRLGHRAGDACLRSVGDAVGACIREPGDTLARYGGEEFALVLPGASLAYAVGAAERVRSAVLDLAIPHPDRAAGGCVTISLGVACADPGAGAGAITSPDALVEAADRCLYAAKHRGRNRVASDERPACHDDLATEHVV
jgi:diguanylate cyclase (GGDEF)-like protein